MANVMTNWAAAAKRLQVLRDGGRYYGGIILGEAEALRRDVTALREGGVYKSQYYRDLYAVGRKRLAALEAAASRGRYHYAGRRVR